MSTTVSTGLFVHYGYEQVGAVQVLKQLARPLAAESGPGVLRQLVKERRGQHEVDDFGRLAVKHLVQAATTSTVTAPSRSRS
jgi:hypothetical protein